MNTSSLRMPCTSDARIGLALLIFVVTHALWQPLVAQEAPRVLDARYRLEQVAAAPDIVTPVGITFDHDDQLLVIESHTHQRSDEYDGPAHDLVKRFVDDNGDGKIDRIQTFWKGTAQTMSLLRGKDRWIYIATRRDIQRVRDNDRNGIADEHELLVRLATRGDYPHNGLSGLTLSPEGQLVFGMGENLGEPYELIAADGSITRGEAEGGNVFRCNADGTQLVRVATGFWNPFGNCFDSEGRLFCVDNDPDASPPCRLLHVVSTGDYGYQFRYGRSGRHPLQAWDAELPATLPMAAGTGEAPCQIVPYRGRLWVTSWGDFRLEAFTLQTVGASCQAEAEVIVQGDAQFRPVGLAIGPDESLYFSDWVDRSYPVHGRGAIWRLVPLVAATDETIPALSAAEIAAATLSNSTSLDRLLDGANDDDPFLRQAAIAGLSKRPELMSIDLGPLSTRQQVAVIAARRWTAPTAASQWLDDDVWQQDDDVCVLALRCVAECRLEEYRSRILEILQRRRPLSARLGLVAVSALAWLDQDQESKDLGPLHARLAEYLDDPQAAPALRQLALRTLPADHAAVSMVRLRNLLNEASSLQEDVVSLLAERTDPAAADELARIARDDQYSVALRADACAALSAFEATHRDELQQLCADPQPSIRLEAERNLMVRTAAETAPHATASSLIANAAPGDVDRGRRVFFRATGGRCSSCHVYDGRGAHVGPELTTIHRRADRKWLLETILDPNRDVAPRFTTVTLITRAGRSLTGQILPGPGDDAAESLIQSDGTRTDVPLSEIEERHYHTRSIMPEGLGSVLDAAELQDLVAFLLAGN